MRSKASFPPPAIWSDASILPRSSSLVKMPSAGGQVPTQMAPPASASALAMAKPKPPSSATPATNARFPVKSILSMSSRLPANGRASPGEPGAERSEEQQVAAPQTPLREGLVERDRDGSGGGVAVLLDVYIHLLVGQPEALLHHLDDAQVRLMRDKELHVGGGEAFGAERQLDRLRHQHGGVLEHLAPVHDRAMLAGGEQLLAHVRIVRQARSVHPQLLGVAPVGEEMGGPDAAPVVVRGAEDGDSRPVAEQDGRVAPARGAVEPAGVHLRPHEQDAAILPRADPRVGYGEAVQEAAALVAHVDRGDAREAELALQKHAVAGLEMVRRAGAIHDAVQVARLEPRFAERAAGRLAGEPGTGLPFAHPVAGANAAPLPDPLVRGVHELRQIEPRGAWLRGASDWGRFRRRTSKAREPWSSGSAGHNWTRCAAPSTCPTSWPACSPRPARRVTRTSSRSRTRKRPP